MQQPAQMSGLPGPERSACHPTVTVTGHTVRAALVTAMVIGAAPALAGSDAYSYFESTHTDQLSADPADIEQIARTDNRSDASPTGSSSTVLSGTASTTYQSHGFDIAAGVSVGPPSLNARHAQTITTMDGVRPTAMHWVISDTQLFTQLNYTDQIGFQPMAGGGLPIATVDVLWQLNASFDQVLDIDAERALYRLSTALHFAADAGGAERQKINVEQATYDPHAGGHPPPFFWSVLEGDIALQNQPVSFPGGNLPFLVIDLVPMAGGLFMPIDLKASLTMDTRNRFLNDGPEINYLLHGHVDYDFSNSADLLGLVIRDTSGAIRTDVTVSSANGVSYPVLSAPIPEPAAAGMLALGLVVLALRRRRATLTGGTRG